MPVYDDVTQVVGNTPLVRINRIIDGALRTTGGRVLAVTALDEDPARARERVNGAAASVRFTGAWHRTDIGVSSSPVPMTRW